MANCNQSGSETPVANVGLLTKMFVNLLKNAEYGIIDLNNAADTLDWRCVFLYQSHLLFKSFIKKLMLFTGAKEAYLWYNKCVYNGRSTLALKQISIAL